MLPHGGRGNLGGRCWCYRYGDADMLRHCGGQFSVDVSMLELRLPEDGVGCVEGGICRYVTSGFGL